MLRAIGRRLASVPILLFIVTVIVTAMTALIPGDPAVTIAGENASPERIAEIRDRLGYDRPFVGQYVDWVGNALRGDFGDSLFTPRSVGGLLVDRLPITASLTFGALLVALVVGAPLGMIAGLRRGTFVDRVATSFASLGVSIPSYWLGLLLLLVLSIRYQIFPAIGYVHFGDDPWQWFVHLVLPSIALGASAAAELARQLRSAVADVLQEDYIRTARAKGLGERSVVVIHATKNAAGPAITVLGLQVALLLGGAVVVEQIFAIPGLGQLSVVAVVQRDIPLIQGIVVLSTLTVVVANLLVDVIQIWLNPKLRSV